MEAPWLNAEQGGQEDVVAATNEELVSSGLRLLRSPISVFICQHIQREFGESWWTEGVLETLVYDKTPTVEAVRRYRRLPESGTIDECASAIDISVCLILLTKQWPRIFGKALGQDHRGWAYELIGVRNQKSHLVGADLASDFTWRALDTMARVCEPIDPVVAKDILALRSTVDLSEYGQAGASSARWSAVSSHAASPVEAESRPAGERTAFAPATPPASAANASVAVPASTPKLDTCDPESEELRDDLAVAGPDFSGADLRKMNFAGANLSGADFTDADLTGANLSGAVLTHAVFRNSSLGDADLTKANLSGAVFDGTTLSAWLNKGHGARSYGANLAGATTEGATLNFVGSDLRNAVLSGLNLAGADFSGANLGEADLTKANLSGAVFDGTTLSAWLNKGHGARSYGANLAGVTADGTAASFVGADLRSADLSGAALPGADFTKANLTGAILKGAVLTRALFKNSNLGDADLTEVNLTDAAFEGTTLSVWLNKGPGARAYGANLTGSTLDGAILNFAESDLRRATLSGLNLEGADFSNSDLTGADLHGAILRGVNLKGANIKDANTAGVRWV